MKRNRVLVNKRRSCLFVCARISLGLCIVYSTISYFRLLFQFTRNDRKLRSAKKNPIKSKKLANKTKDDGIVNINPLPTVKPLRTNVTCPLLAESTSKVSISLVMHSTVNRLWIMEETCRRWKGPIVLVIYYHPTKTKSLPWMLVLDWKKACPQVKLVPVEAPEGEEEWQYPVNKLRNKGLDALETSLFLMMDIDFLPSGNLEAAIHSHFLPAPTVNSGDSDMWQQQQQKIAMVVPAFERKNADCTSISGCKKFLKLDPDFIPLSFEDMGTCNKKGNCGVFHADEFVEGHLTTGTEFWLKGDFYDYDPVLDVDVPRKITCFHSFNYEPYVVLPWCKGSTPYYDERFYGYGKNKIQYISHLRFLNYSFQVLPEGFLVHYPNPKSKANGIFRRESKFHHRQSMSDLYEEFLRELNETYAEPTLRQCESTADETISQ